MIRTLLHKSFSVSLAILVVFSTLSVTIEKHYCGDQLVGLSIFSSAEKCGMESTVGATKTIKPCCKDTVELIKGQDDLTKLDSEISNQVKSLFVPSLNYTRLAFVEVSTENEVANKGYEPPPLIFDNQSYYQVYLI